MSLNSSDTHVFGLKARSCKVFPDTLAGFQHFCLYRSAFGNCPSVDFLPYHFGRGGNNNVAKRGKRRSRSRRSTGATLLEQLEDVSWRVFEEYPEVVQELIRKRPGVYVLYRKRRVYYIGLASNLMHRLKSHLKDHHEGLWDRFSVYLAGDAEHIKALESLLLHIVEPKGNKQSGRFPGARNLLALMNRRMTELDADRRARLLGGVIAERRLRSRARRGRAAAVFAGLSERRISLRAAYKGKPYRASLRKNGTIGFRGKVYASPSAAARQIVKRHVNGLWFWRFRNKKRNWVQLRTLLK